MIKMYKWLLLGSGFGLTVYRINEQKKFKSDADFTQKHPYVDKGICLSFTSFWIGILVS